MKKTYSVSSFKARALGLIETVSKTGEPVTITKRGKPIAKVIPFERTPEKPKAGQLSGTLVEVEEIISPLGPEIWKAAEN